MSGSTFPVGLYSWVATRCGLHKPVSASLPLKTGLAPLRASGLTPVVNLHGDTMKRLCPFLQLHRRSPVASLRVRWVPLFPSFQRLGAFAISPHPAVDGSPVRRLLRPIRHCLRHRSFVGGSLPYFPLSFASVRQLPVFIMWDSNEMG